MTEDEKRQQKAMLLLEHQEAEQHLSHLEAKASTLSQRLLAVSEWLETAAKRHQDVRDEFYLVKLGSKVNIMQDPQIQIAMNFDEVVGLVQEIRQGRARVNELYQRKKSLGLN